jgi:hypothetical protein
MGSKCKKTGLGRKLNVGKRARPDNNVTSDCTRPIEKVAKTAGLLWYGKLNSTFVSNQSLRKERAEFARSSPHTPTPPLAPVPRPNPSSHGIGECRGKCALRGMPQGVSLAGTSCPPRSPAVSRTNARSECSRILRTPPEVLTRLGQCGLIAQALYTADAAETTNMGLKTCPTPTDLWKASRLLRH